MHELSEEQLALAFEKIKKIKKAWFIMFNLAYVIIYITYAILIFYYKENTLPWLPYVVISIAVIYFISFCFILTIKNDKTVKLVVKNYKIILRMLNRGLKLFTLILSIIMVANTVLFDPSAFTFILTVLNIVLICLQTIRSVYKFIKINYKKKQKEEKRFLKKELVVDILSILFAFNANEDELLEEHELELEQNTTLLVNNDNPSNPQDVMNNETAVGKYKNNKYQLKKMFVNYFQGDNLLGKAKHVIEKGFVNSLSNADRIITRYNEYKEDKAIIKKRNKR